MNEFHMTSYEDIAKMGKQDARKFNSSGRVQNRDFGDRQDQEWEYIKAVNEYFETAEVSEEAQQRFWQPVREVA